jgi:hypothetical protein
LTRKGSIAYLEIRKRRLLSRLQDLLQFPRSIAIIRRVCHWCAARQLPDKLIQASPTRNVADIPLRALCFPEPTGRSKTPRSRCGSSVSLERLAIG